MNESFCCSTSLSAFGAVSVLDFGHRSVRMSNCSFYLPFSDDIPCGASFQVHICHLCDEDIQMSVKVFGPLFSRVVCFLMAEFQTFCIFCLTVLYEICPLQMFSPSLWLLFLLLDSVFHRAENFNFNEVQLTNSFHGLCL